jgi:hypothetical protein
LLSHKAKQLKEIRNSMKKVSPRPHRLRPRGCNTISGIGKDVQKVGQVVTGAGGK